LITLTTELNIDAVPSFSPDDRVIEAKATVFCLTSLMVARMLPGRLGEGDG